MKTIAQFVKDRIKSLPDLQDALQTAMRLEFSTIPPYLCAQWSINADPGGVGNMIQTIVVQEMYHFALAGNMLTAIGGTPSIANATFLPSYPTHVLPGGIAQKLAVDLKPLTPDQAQVFMQIEYPEFTPVALAAGPATQSPTGSQRSSPRSSPTRTQSIRARQHRSKALPMRSRRSRSSRAKAKERGVPRTSHRKVRRRLPITTCSKRSLPRTLW
jgi:Ferritin-like